MEGLDDTGPLGGLAQRAQTQVLPCEASGTHAKSSAVNEACVHQQGDSLPIAAAIAHRFGPPHRGQEAESVANAFADMATAPWHSPPA